MRGTETPTRPGCQQECLPPTPPCLLGTLPPRAALRLPVKRKHSSQRQEGKSGHCARPGWAPRLHDLRRGCSGAVTPQRRLLPSPLQHRQLRGVGACPAPRTPVSTMQGSDS